MSTNSNNIPNFLDRVYFNRKDGTVISFDESELLIEFDDGERDWVRADKVRLTRRAEVWAYLPDGSLLPFAKGLMGE